MDFYFEQPSDSKVDLAMANRSAYDLSNQGE